MSKQGAPTKQNRDRRRDSTYRYIGIDGEGQGRGDHRYVMLGASDEHGEFAEVLQAHEGGRLGTRECLDFLLSLPTKRTKLFTYSFGYDLTMMLREVDDKTLYMLFRPELRQRHGAEAMKGPIPVRWRGYRLNLQGTKFTIRRGSKRTVIWDVWKFFQSKFVGALKDWKVGHKELWDRMSNMKDKRGEFDKESLDAVREYMLEECRCMAQLARKLDDAHKQAGLKLKTYYGAGSSGAAMLTVMGVREKLNVTPEPMRDAVAAAFFGGRFENSVIGAIGGRVFNYDISSAYPYHTTFLPCLLHGEWEQAKGQRDILDTATIALVRYSLGGKPRFTSWGPFPFRDDDGSISYPIESGGGWVWLSEFLAGERAFPGHVLYEEAWIYRAHCDCKPFAGIPKYYKHRLLLGKEGPGIVIKLAVNSCYGKLAQSVGNALFNSWIWAGMITAGCRAQVLDVLAMHRDRANLLMIATDGIYTRERLDMPKPRDTDTANAVNDKGELAGKPLGGWEEKIVDKGIFVARPGIYFPMSPTVQELKDVRGRGVGKGVVLENWKRIVEAWERDGLNAIAEVANVTRFCGAKTSIHHSKSKGYTRAAATDGIKPSYGNWITRRVEMSFHPMPKRSGVNPDGVTLELRTFPRDLTSVPYDRALISKEALEMKAALEEVEEQPDIDYSDYT